MSSLEEWLRNGLGMAAWGCIFLVFLYLILRKPFDAYLTEVGKNYATKEDFKNLKARLVETTEIAERAKRQVNDPAWVAQQRWSRREAQFITLLGALLTYEQACDGLAVAAARGQLMFQTNTPAMREYSDAAKSLYYALGAAEMYIAEETITELTSFVHSVYADSMDGAHGGAWFFRNRVTKAKTLRAIVLREAKAQLAELEG